MKLTSRIKRILFLLLNETNYITVQFIADKTNISSRTVIRELNIVESWLNEKGIPLEKKKGTGIRIILDVSERERIKKSLLEEKADLIYSPEQRLVMLKAELLKKFELTKLYTLTRLFNVTEGTISADLDKLEIWFSKYKLILIRKPGLGIYIDGTEVSIRSAIISLIYEQFHEADLINLIINKEEKSVNFSLIQNKINKVILDFIGKDSIEKARDLLAFIEERMGYQIADNSYISLVIRISVTVKRSNQRIFVKNIEPYTKKIYNEKIYQLLKEWFSMQTDIKYIPNEEIFYLAVHIKGAKLRETFLHNKISMTEDYKTIKLAKEIIYTAERETGIYLEDNEKLLIGLVRHLRPAIYRMKMLLDIMNPLLADIKQMYPQLFEATRKCAKVIEEKEQVIVPEDEIAYLATHIGAAIKSERRDYRKIFRAVVACTNGIGASQLLVTEIEKEFPNIHVVDSISTFDMRESKLLEAHIDLILTTVPMTNLSIPTILVHIILTDEDRKKIKDVLENFLPEHTYYESEKNTHFIDKVKGIKHYSDLIIQVLNNYSFIEHIELHCVEGLIKFVSHKIAKDLKAEEILINAFKDREEKGSTILSKKGMMLLHCRSKAVDELYVMVVRTENQIKLTNSRGELSQIDTIIVMVAPLNISNHALEVLSEITRKIITSDFSITLKKGSKEDIFVGISNILDYFIQSKVIIAK